MPLTSWQRDCLVCPQSFFILNPGSYFLNRFTVIEFFSLISLRRRRRGSYLMKKSKIRRCRPHSPIAPSLQKSVITDHDIRLRTPEILLQLKCGRIQKIVHKNDGGVLDEIESFVHGEMKSLSNLTGDLVAFQFAFKGVEYYEPILSAWLNFFSACKHANP